MIKLKSIIKLSENTYDDAYQKWLNSAESQQIIDKYLEKFKILKKINFLKGNDISIGVQTAIQEGRYHKNKIPLNEYENIKSLYLSGSINQRNLALKYGITPSSMAKLLKRLGVK